MNTPPPPLTVETLRRASTELAQRDHDLARVLSRLGPPPLWDREPGFPTLVRIILEQQVSLASAKAAFDKLAHALSPLEPAAFLDLDDTDLKAFGFSGQKGSYCRALARAVLDGSIDLERLPTLPDAEVRANLITITGIGRWTADVYLLMALGRPDIWPRGDLALHGALRDLKRLPALPSAAAFETLGKPWRPWRSVAARLLWHHYLNPE